MSETSAIRLWARKYLDGVNAPNGAVATVLAFDAEGRRTPAQDVPEVTVPIGWNVTPASVPVAPGNYLVELRLPNGELTSTEVTVTDQPVEVEIDLTHSPREWLSWQHFLGGVPLHEDLHTRQAGGPVEVRWLTGVGPRLFRTAGGDPWRDLLAVVTRRRTPPRGRSLGPPHQESGWSHHRLGAQGRLDNWIQDDPHPGDHGEPRHYLLTRAGSTSWLLPAPIPWWTRSGAVALDLLVRHQDQADAAGAGQVMLSPLDPDIAPLLGYLMGGSARSARLVVDHAEARELLFLKFINPLAAAAGGYALLSSEETGDTAWHPWIRNLAARFEWLPDGAIQQGRLLLRHRRGPDDVARARAAFVDACARGLPFYTLGLLWLVDGLSLLADSGDEEARRLLAPVQEVSWHADLTQPFTTLRLGDPTDDAAPETLGP